MKFITTNCLLVAACIFLAVILTGCQQATEKKDLNLKAGDHAIPIFAQTTDIPEEITTPDLVTISIGELGFYYGIPTQSTAESVYNNLYRMHGVDAFLKAKTGASIGGLIIRMQGPLEPRINQT